MGVVWWVSVCLVQAQSISLQYIIYVCKCFIASDWAVVFACFLGRSRPPFVAQCWIQRLYLCIPPPSRHREGWWGPLPDGHSNNRQGILIIHSAAFTAGQDTAWWHFFSPLSLSSEVCHLACLERGKKWGRAWSLFIVVTSETCPISSACFI